MDILLKLTPEQYAALDAQRMQMRNRNGLPEFASVAAHLVDKIESQIMVPAMQQVMSQGMAEARAKLDAANLEFQSKQRQISILEFEEKV